MRRNALSISRLAVAATLLVAALVTAVFFVLRSDVATEEQALLQSQTDQLGTALNVAVNGLQNLLTGVANVEAVTNNSPQMWRLQTTPLLAASPLMSMAVVRTSPGTGTVVLAAGSLFHAGEPLPPVMAAALAGAGRPRCSPSAARSSSGSSRAPLLLPRGPSSSR